MEVKNIKQIYQGLHEFIWSYSKPEVRLKLIKGFKKTGSLGIQDLAAINFVACSNFFSSGLMMFLYILDIFALIL